MGHVTTPQHFPSVDLHAWLQRTVAETRAQDSDQKWRGHVTAEMVETAVFPGKSFWLSQLEQQSDHNLSDHNLWFRSILETFDWYALRAGSHVSTSMTFLSL